MMTPAHQSDRRCAARRSPAADEPLARLRLRVGTHLQVVDISNAGVLVEGEARLLPGTHVDVHVITADGRLLVRSRIVRAYVARLEAERIRFRGALAFERPIDTSPCAWTSRIPSMDQAEPVEAMRALGFAARDRAVEEENRPREIHGSPGIHPV